MHIRPTHPGSRCCAAVQFEVDLPQGLVEPGRCNCSLRRRRGPIMAAAPLDAFRVTAGAEHLRLYRFNTATAKHYFCGICVVYTHHQRSSNPAEVGFNAGCSGASIRSSSARCPCTTASIIRPIGRRTACKPSSPGRSSLIRGVARRCPPPPRRCAASAARPAPRNRAGRLPGRGTARSGSWLDICKRRGRTGSCGAGDRAAACARRES